MSQLSQSVFRRILTQTHHHRCIDLSKVEAELRNRFPRKIKVSGLNIQRKQNYLLQHCEKPLKISRETNYCTVLFLLSNLSGNFVESIFAGYFLNQKKHNLMYNTIVNSEGEATYCVVLKIYILKNFSFETQTGHNTLVTSRENRKTLCISKTSYMSR